MGNRPGLVVSPIDFNRKIGFAFVCPVSNTQRQNPFYVKIPGRSTAIVGLPSEKSELYRQVSRTVAPGCSQKN